MFVKLMVLFFLVFEDECNDVMFVVSCGIVDIVEVVDGFGFLYFGFSYFN